MSGTFGYELDLGKLKRTECTAVKNQIKRFKRLNDLIRTGDYYRLTTRQKTHISRHGSLPQKTAARHC